MFEEVAKNVLKMTANGGTTCKFKKIKNFNYLGITIKHINEEKIKIQRRIIKMYGGATSISIQEYLQKC